MNTGERSLRFLIEKWLGSTMVLHVGVVESGRMRPHNGRYVHVEVHAPTGPRGMFFFRHDDGCWCVFPLEPRGRR